MTAAISMSHGVSNGDVSNPESRYVIGGVPFDYHGPVDFPCYGCALRSLSAYHGVRVSRARLMFEGTFRFGYAYRLGSGFFTSVKSWIDAGYFASFRRWYEHGAAVTGVAIRFLPTEPGDPWASVWRAWKDILRQDEPIYLSLRDAGILWRGVGLPAPAEGPGHCLVLIGYDESRGVAICHDNWWSEENTHDEDRPVVEYRLDDLARSFADRRNVPPFVVTGSAPPLGRSVRELVLTQAEIMLGERVHIAFLPPADAADFATGYHALHAAAADIRALESVEQARSLFTGLHRFLMTGWWMGVDGQPARAAWLSGIAAATRVGDIDLAASFVDDVASALALARRSYRSAIDLLTADAVDMDKLRPPLDDLARHFDTAGDAEKRAGEALKAAASQLPE